MAMRNQAEENQGKSTPDGENGRRKGPEATGRGCVRNDKGPTGLWIQGGTVGDRAGERRRNQMTGLCKAGYRNLNFF